MSEYLLQVSEPLALAFIPGGGKALRGNAVYRAVAGGRAHYIELGCYPKGADWLVRVIIPSAYELEVYDLLQEGEEKPHFTAALSEEEDEGQPFDAYLATVFGLDTLEATLLAADLTEEAAQALVDLRALSCV